MLGIALFIASININELMRLTVKSRAQKNAEKNRENRIKAFNKDKEIVENLLAKDITELSDEDISSISSTITRIKGTARNLRDNSYTEAAQALEDMVQLMQEARLQLQQVVKDEDVDGKPSGDDADRGEDNADRKPSGDEVYYTEGYDEQSEEEGEAGVADLTGQPKAAQGKLEDEENLSEDGYDFVRSNEITEGDGESNDITDDPVLIALDPNTGGAYSSDEGSSTYANVYHTGMPTTMPSSAPSGMPTAMPSGMPDTIQFLQPIGIIDDIRNYEFPEIFIGLSR